MTHLLRLWFGVSLPVRRQAYALSGCGLMLLKYVVEAAAVWIYASAIYWPWHFVNPLVSVRAALLEPAPQWLGWAMLTWSLPFLWIAITMSVRRAADAGRSPWAGLLILVPLVNLVAMVVLCFLPSTESGNWSPHGRAAHESSPARSAVFALGISLLIGGVMIGISVYLLSSYGASLFLGTPIVMGAAAAYWHNRASPRGYGESVSLGGGAVLVGGAALLLFALEGLICVVMATPLMLPLGGLGALMGKAIADSTRRPPHELMGVILILPILAVAETRMTSTTEYVVMTAVEIDAPPEVVWEHVVDFPELPPPDEWYFRMGIACPERARIEGEGVGATRYCEFTTGTFVEPVTAWEPARRLAFDVTDQPAPMFELSPYRHVHPPHLEGYLRSTRGEFRLIALPNGRTRLEGRTWYEFDMFPQSYWTLWSDLLIHRIHTRVLLHIKQLTEDDALYRRCT